MSQIDTQLRADFDKIGKPAKYGTAGFRDLATYMPYISFRVGVFVAILNKTQPSKSLGVVMSASHNKIQDNGVKITNFSGNMLEMSYEVILEKFVSEKDLEKAVKDFKEYLTNQGRTVFGSPVSVFIGGDTRPSTPELLQLVAKGVECAGGKTIDFELTTTPQLQYYVYLYNTVIQPNTQEPCKIDPQALKPLYWQNFSSYYRNSMKYLKSSQVKHRCLDCANGIGGKIIPFFQKQLKDLIQLDLINNSNPELLNKNCGADFIKVDKKFPSEYTPKEYNCFVSFDGDADRIVEFVQQDKELALIDGDRQGTVFTTFYKRISEQLKERTQKLIEAIKIKVQALTNPSIGFVQTYYANYSSSQYLNKNFKMEPIYAATGVKFLHEKAQHFDIGVYFEANGHGTVIFNEKFLNQIQSLLQSKENLLKNQSIQENEELKQKVDEYFEFVEFYLNACKLANPSVGDAICNLLIFELALTYLKLTYKDTLELYTDLKSKTSKIAVKSKENVRTTNIEDQVTSPKGLQQQIDQVVRKHDGKKAFLRPSGTENVLRLHVEAKTERQVEEITKEINVLVSSHPELN